MYTTRRFFRAIFIPQKIVQATLNDKSISQKFEKTRVYPFESRRARFTRSRRKMARSIVDRDQNGGQ